jgi:hypothetical protein
MLAYTNVSRRGASARAQHGSARVQVCNCRMPGRVQRTMCAAASLSVAARVRHHANTNDIVNRTRLVQRGVGVRGRQHNALGGVRLG